jgi:hypothetical protein
MASVVRALRPAESAWNLLDASPEKAPASNMWKLATCKWTTA